MCLISDVISDNGPHLPLAVKEMEADLKRQPSNRRNERRMLQALIMINQTTVFDEERATKVYGYKVKAHIQRGEGETPWRPMFWVQSRKKINADWTSFCTCNPFIVKVSIIELKLI